MMKKTARIILFVASAALLLSCDAWKDHFPEAEELGVLQGEYVIPSSGMTVQVDYLSNLRGSVLCDAAWIVPETDVFEGDGRFAVTCPSNGGFPRVGRIILKADGRERSDTVVFKQYGTLSPEFTLAASSYVVYNSTGETVSEVPVTTNLSLEDLEIEVLYTGEAEGWLKQVDVSAGKLLLTTRDNTSRTRVNKAVIRFKYRDGWGDPQYVSLDVIQANSDNALGIVVTFGELRASADAAEEGSYAIVDDMFMDAYVVSDPSSGNVADCPNLSTSKIDYSASEKSAYIESLDGRYGFWVECESVEDNVLRCNTKVRLLLGGAVIRRLEDPLRYKLEAFTSSMVSSAEDVDASVIPLKEKHIGELTDEDLYTRVRLLDCELPVRKGSMTPVNELYTVAHYASGVGTYDYVSKVPLLLRDINGDSMYILTNMTCPYRRDGTRLNWGKGSMTGVIVHEKYRRYVDEDAEDEDDCGNIGRYQIRHFSRADFDFEEDFSDSFSGLVTEYRWVNAGNEDYSISPTYGNGSLTHTSGKIYDANHSYVRYAAETYSCLGPVGFEGSIFGLHTGNPNGTGILLDDGTDYLIHDGFTNLEGAGKTVLEKTVNGVRERAPRELILSWRHDYWYDATSGRCYEWLISFSTSDIHSDRLSMQLSTLNQYAGDAPRHWKAEWSLTGDVKDDSEWTLIGEYDCPDFFSGSSRNLYMAGSFKAMDFPLPASLCGKEKVYIRLKPRDTVAGTANTYSGGSLTTSPTEQKARNCIDYFAIRYNK